MKEALLQGCGLCKSFPGTQGAVLDGVTDGEVLFQGRRISGLPETEMARLRACSFGFVFQQTHLVSNLTLFENVAVAGYVAHERSPKEVECWAQALLDQMGVGNAKDRYPAQVSGGEGQRAAIARAMVNEPGLLFADEPTGAFNALNRVLYLEDGKLMDELTLEPYGPERAMEREARLNAWLSALRW